MYFAAALLLLVIVANTVERNDAYVVVQKSNGNLWLIVPNRKLVTQLALNDEAFSSNLGDVFGGSHMAMNRASHHPDYERWILNKRGDRYNPNAIKLRFGK